MNEANYIHNNIYNYSKFTYINNKIKGIIICRIHGEFLQNASSHLSGKGCKKCAAKTNGKKKRLNNILFINKANIIHFYKYDYSKFEYIKSNIDGIIICSLHGEFLQKPNNHLNGQGCKICGLIKLGNDKIIKAKNAFIEKANLKHNNKYDYSKFSYIDAHNKSIIICKIHGEFLQTPNAHLNGTNCPKCILNEISKRQLKPLNNFIKEASILHNDKYDYSKFVYFGNKSNSIIICNVHGEFNQSAHHHLSGHGCRKCAGSFPISNEYVDEKLLTLCNNIKRIADVNGADTPIKWMCEKCNGIWSATPSNILNRETGCPFCKNKNEKFIFEILKDNNINFEYQKNIKILDSEWNKNYRLDFYISSSKVAIEYNGHQHYQPVRFGGISQEEADKNFIKQQTRDEYVRNYSKLNNIKLIEIDGRIYKNNKLKNYINNEILPLLDLKAA